MTAKSKSKAPAQPAEDFDKEAKQAPKRPEIFDKLRFGSSKEAEGSYDIQFCEPRPRTIEFEDQYAEPDPETGEQPRGEAWAIACDVLDVKEFNDARPGERRSLILRKPDAGKDGEKKYHSLTQSILNIYNEKGSLQGVKVRVATTNYNHDRHGKTRRYEVLVLGDKDSKPDEDFA